MSFFKHCCCRAIVVFVCILVFGNIAALNRNLDNRKNGRTAFCNHISLGSPAHVTYISTFERTLVSTHFGVRSRWGNRTPILRMKILRPNR